MTYDDDADLAAVRETVAARTAAPERPLGRAWATITADRTALPSPPRRPARWLVPVGAAATVAALAVGAVAVLGGGGEPDLQLADPPLPSESDGVPRLGPTSDEAVSALHALAEAAEQGEPVTYQDGQLIYFRHDGWASAFGPRDDGYTGVIERQLIESWTALETMDPGLTTWGEVPDQHVEDYRGSGDAGSDGRADTEPLSRPEPGPYLPTPQWLAELPTDPKALIVTLRLATHPHGAESADHQVWEAVGDLYQRAEILLAPELRAALLRGLADIRGLEASEVEIDGRRLIGIQQTDLNSGPGEGLLFDPATGRAVGRRTFMLDERVTLIQPSDGPPLEPGVSYQALWTHSIVDEVGETGNTR